jgi:hypothetical protein
MMSVVSTLSAGEMLQLVLMDDGEPNNSPAAGSVACEHVPTVTLGYVFHYCKSKTGSVSGACAVGTPEPFK